jgi:hypothetical protein
LFSLKRKLLNTFTANLDFSRNVHTLPISTLVEIYIWSTGFFFLNKLTPIVGVFPWKNFPQRQYLSYYKILVPFLNQLDSIMGFRVIALERAKVSYFDFFSTIAALFFYLILPNLHTTRATLEQLLTGERHRVLWTLLLKF